MKRFAQKGFSTIIVLLVVVLGVAGLTGWYVWQKQEPVGSDTKEAANGSSATDASSSAGDFLSLNESKLPNGWAVEAKGASNIQLRNASSQCFVNTIATTDTAESNSPDIDHNKQIVTNIQAKGYTVQATPAKLAITTSSGEKQLDAQALELTGQDNPAFQIYAFVAKTELYTEIQLSCPSSTDLPTAKAALTAITLNTI